MSFAFYNGEKDLPELARKLFDIKGRRAADVEIANKAGEALLKANPHLSDLTKVPDGTLIIIPSPPDIPIKEPQTAGSGAEIGNQLELAINELDDMIGRSVASDEQAAATIIEALKSRDLKDIASRSPEIKAKLEEFSNAAKNRLKAAKANAAAEKDALNQLREALGKLIR
jgi:hypothetical protein